MAQTTPTPPAEGLPRPLPRGGRISAKSKNTRPRFQSIDAAWMAGIAALFVGFSVWTRGLYGQDWYGASAGTVTVLLTYLLGWRASGRVAGIIGALLLATSAAFALDCPDDLRVCVFTVLTVASLFAFVAGSSLAALGLAALAAGFRADGALLGLLLLALTVAQHRQRALFGVALFLVLTAGTLYLGFYSRSIPLLLTLGFQSDLGALILAPSVLFLLWFLLPFCGELGDPVRRARWLPVVLWTLASLIVLGFVSLGASGLAPFLPLWPLLFVLIGGGLARLMPALSGEFPAPFVRYILATLAVIFLVGLHVRQEWPLWHSSPTPASIKPAVPATPATTPAPRVTPPSAPVPSVAPSAPVAPVPKLPAAGKPIPPLKKSHLTVPAQPKAGTPVKPAVPLYHMVNGRLVKRSPWAIQWDETHPQH